MAPAFLSALGGVKLIAPVTALAVVAGGGAAYLAFTGEPDQIVVVQRSSTVEIGAQSENTVVTGCKSHETVLNGGYAVGGDAIATRSQFAGAAWLASAYNPGDAPVQLTSYAVCVNARVEFEPSGDFASGPHAFIDRSDKISAGFSDLTTQGPWAGLSAGGVGSTACHGDFQQVGAEFRPARSVAGKPVRPVPLRTNAPVASGGWFVGPNAGTRLTSAAFALDSFARVHRETRILAPQPPEANYAVEVRPVCVKLSGVALVTAQLDVPAGGSAPASAACKSGSYAVGGGYSFAGPPVEAGLQAEAYLDDGWLTAPRSAPTRTGTSGSAVRRWYVDARSARTPGANFSNSVWRIDDNPGDTHFGVQPPSPRHVAVSRFTVPDSTRVTVTAICATFSGEPTKPTQTAEVVRPPLPPALDLGGLAPTVAPSPTTSPSPSPSATPTTSPSPSASTSTSASPSPSPSRAPSPKPKPTTASPKPTVTKTAQPPIANIITPTPGTQIRWCDEEPYAGTATAQPSGAAITGSNVVWTLRAQSGTTIVIGTGTSGEMNIPKSFPYGEVQTVTMTVTDPVSRLKSSDSVSVENWFCGA